MSTRLSITTGSSISHERKSNQEPVVGESLGWLFTFESEQCPAKSIRRLQSSDGGEAVLGIESRS